MSHVKMLSVDRCHMTANGCFLIGTPCITEIRGKSRVEQVRWISPLTCEYPEWTILVYRVSTDSPCERSASHT
jgi:hypothetical protein